MSAAVERRSGRFPRWGWICVGGLLLLASAGCNRGFYRRQADREAYRLMDRAACATDSLPADYSIQPNPESRMFDPNCPDLPPMPPDDPVSHRLMHCVDCKRGWPCWRCYGKTELVDNLDWEAYLPYDETGKIVLHRNGAVELALLHSRDYQRALEALYVSALDVTLQRFRFDVQFFGGNSTFLTSDGPDRAGGSSSLLTTDTDLQMRKLLATGGELVVGVANSLVWQFAGPDGYGANTLLDFSLVQPLLRAGGRAVVLESLTDSERALLANIRQMERFRRGFYTQIVTGGGAIPAPARGGPGLRAASAGGRFGGGYFGLLEEQLRIRNQRANVTGLRTSVERLEAFYEADRITRYQVGFTRQGLYRAQTSLLSQVAAYQARLDAYKITLGLPPQLEVTIEDPMLARFNLIDPKFTETRDKVSLFLIELRDQREAGGLDPRGDNLEKMQSILEDVMAQFNSVKHDLQRLEETLPARRENLRQLSAREEFQQGDIDPSVGDFAALDGRVATLYEDLNGSDDYAGVAERLTTSVSELKEFAQESADYAANPAADLVHDNLIDRVDRLSGELLELSLIQAGTRLDTIMLEPIEATPERALEIARENRRDWKNARAALVDSWRQVEVVANDLQSDLDVVFSGDLNTKDNNPIRFRGTTGRLRAGLAFDAPLTRLAERNAYREVLIDYQQARRQYYTVEDEIAESLRDTIRTIRLNRLNFEVQRAAVFQAIDQVYEAQLKLEEPGGTKLGVNTARNLVDALSDLLDAQNAILGIWVNQESLRMSLDLDLGTMELDNRGIWIDPGPLMLTEPASAQRDPAVEEDPWPDELEEILTPAGVPLENAGR